MSSPYLNISRCNYRRLLHNPVHRRNVQNETETQKICFGFLEKTSRSFSAVIQELHPELVLPVCIFYLVLRGLDTIEDDTSIPLKTKEPLLRGFKDIIEKEEKWTFDGNRPEEKDRELLVRFDNIITEYQRLKPSHRFIVNDITNKMGNGMADFCCKREAHDFPTDVVVSINTIAEYDLYCFYVAGLVGEGLTRLFIETELSSSALLGRQLHGSMALFLQKTNIIRDVQEDYHDQRRFWPREIWTKHVANFDDLLKIEYQDAALRCSSEMVLNALRHVEHCLGYLAELQEQSIFNFCAIPQSMAIATLELCFRNPAIFSQSIKITKGDACQLMTESTQNIQTVCEVFRRYARRIQQKNTSNDPSSGGITEVCGKVRFHIPLLC